MNIHIAVSNKVVAEAERLANLRLERARAQHVASECERMTTVNAHAPSTVKELCNRLEATNECIAELDTALATRWTQPSQQAMQKIDAIHTRVIRAQTGVAFAETEIAIAVRDEKPKQESSGRANLDASERELASARKELRKALEAVGLDPSAL